MFKRIKILISRHVLQHLTARTVAGFVVVYCLLKALKYGVLHYKNLERFYVKVGAIII